MRVKKGIRIFDMIVLLMFFLTNFFLIKSCIATGTTVYVDDSNISGPWDGTLNFPYKTIHEGIDAASANDTVYVFSGIYNENVVITKDLILVGENKETTFIDGGGNGHVLYAHDINESGIYVNISNFTVRDAGGSGFDCIAFSYVTSGVIAESKILNSQEGEGISLDHCNAVVIHDNIITNCAVIGVNLIASEQNTIENNIIQNNQKGIQLGSFSINNHITSNTIWDNSVYGIYVVQSSTNVFSLNDFNGDGASGNSQNAKDSSTNAWSSNGQGNYWMDYNKYDNNSDGIGDTPYPIPGGTNVDQYPLGYFKQPVPPGGGNQPPVAVSLSISKNQANAGEIISFTGEGTDTDGYIVGYHWRSNLNGTLSTQQSFSTSTLSIGTHTIYFKVQDNSGAWSVEKTATVTINSLVNNLPTAYIDEITPNPAKQGETVVFKGHGSDQDGTIIGYKWVSSKDGIISTSSSFNKNDLSLGNHIIYFQVKDNSNDMSPSVALSLVIEKNSSYGGSTNHPPIVNIGGPYQGNVNNPVHFDGSGSFDEDGTLISYIWDYGDNHSGIGVSCSHTYTVAGIYTVTLKVIDNGGANATTSTAVEIRQSTSHGDFQGMFPGLNFDIPFPILIVILVLIILGIIGGFLLRMRRR